MIRHGEAPFLECSSKGDRRFSAFYATIRRYQNATIEEIFQGSKVFEDGSTGLSIKAAKGRQAINQKELASLYTKLWQEYLEENPHLIQFITVATGLSDIFGQEGHCCQATELWLLRKKYLKSMTQVRCAACDETHGWYPKKLIPKTFSCRKCHLAQKTELKANVGYSHGRNYPEGHFD